MTDKKVTKGKDGQLYFGKGTKGGKAPQPKSISVNAASVQMDAQPDKRRAAASVENALLKYTLASKYQGKGEEELAEIKAEIFNAAQKIGADFDMIMDNKCGIDGCQYGRGFAPSHYASDRCRSGKKNHCTCDTCF